MSRHLLRPKIKRLIHARARTATAWQHNGTWTINGVNMLNTPTLGSELLTDGAMENWLSATNLTSWTEAAFVSSTVNQETSSVHGGSNAARLDVDGANSSVAISQGAATIGTWYQGSVWAKVNDATGGPIFQLQYGGSFIGRALTTSYAQYISTGRAISTAAFQVNRSSLCTSKSLYFDDASWKAITLNTLFAVRSGVSLPTSIAAAGTIAFGTPVGVVYGLDSISAPTNCIIATHDGNTGIKLEKMVAGVWTTLISTTTAYVAGFLPQIKWVSANTFALYYAGVQKGTNQSVSDAGTGLLHGAFSTSPLNTITGVTVS